MTIPENIFHSNNSSGRDREAIKKAEEEVDLLIVGGKFNLVSRDPSMF